MASSSAETAVKAPKNRSAKTTTPAAIDTKSTTTTTTEDNKHDFFWTYTEEPHRTRRMAIIKAHPEVRPPLCSTYNLL